MARQRGSGCQRRPGEVLGRAMVCRPGSGGCAAEGGCGETGGQRRTGPQALPHRDPAAETTGRDPQPEAVAVPVSRRCLRIGACDRRRRPWLHASEEHGQGAGRARRRPRYGSRQTTWTGITAATGGRGQLGGGAPLDCGLRLIDSNRSPSGWTPSWPRRQPRPPPRLALGYLRGSIRPRAAVPRLKESPVWIWRNGPAVNGVGRHSRWLTIGTEVKRTGAEPFLRVTSPLRHGLRHL